MVWALSLGFTVVAWATDAPPDLIFLHGRVHTEDARRSVAQALAIRGNSIVAVGTDEAVSALGGPMTRRIDLVGRVVLPSIIDAHTHPAQSAQDQDKCSLGDKMLTAAQIRIAVTACLRRQPVLDRDIFAIDPFGLHHTRILATDLDGRKVYSAPMPRHIAH
jgi:hypothetical protein